MAKCSSNPDFHLADGHGYMLDRSHAAACRLNLQFYLWKDALKYNVHPSVSISKSSVIADVATGTGMWAIDVARELPTSQVDGFDIDLKQAPHQRWLPPNLTMSYWNIFEDVPSNLIGKYDFVHARLLVLVIKQSDPRSVIRKLLEMLKPGGYLQWDELDCVNMCVKKVDTSVQAPALEQLRETCYSNGRHDWTTQLPNFVTEEGFQDAHLDYVGDDNELVRAFNEQHLLTMEEFALGLMKVGKDEAALKFQHLIEDSYRESLNGAALCIPRVVCIGRKSK